MPILRYDCFFFFFFFFFFVILRGLLTGKVKRDQKPAEGRLGWVAEDERRKMQCAPGWSSLPAKMFDIIDTAEAIGKKHGRRP